MNVTKTYLDPMYDIFLLIFRSRRLCLSERMAVVVWHDNE